MAGTEVKKRLVNGSKEKDEKINKCNEKGREYFGILKLNGWKTTLIIVCVSLKFGF